MEQDSTLLDIFLYLSYFLVIFAVAAAVLMPLVKSLDHPQSLLKVAGGVVVLIIIFGISYALSSSDMIAVGVREGLTNQGMKLIGAALITMYIMTIVALGCIAVTEVSKYFR